MKNILILFSFLILPIVVFGQTENDSKNLSIGLSFEPNFGFRQLNYTSFNEEVASIRNEVEIPKFGFTTGLNFRYQCSEKLAFDLGFLFANAGMKTDFEPIPNTGQADAPNRAITTFDFNSFIIPLKANYTFKTREKLDFYATAGTSMNFFFSRQTTFSTYIDDTFSAENTNIEEDGFRNLTYSVLVGLGLNYHLSNHFTLNVEPIYRQYITSIGLQPTGKEYLYSVGMNVQVFYDF